MQVVVYRLIGSGAIEDKMFRLQIFKGGLSKTFMEHEQQVRFFTHQQPHTQQSRKTPSLELEGHAGFENHGASRLKSLFEPPSQHLVVELKGVGCVMVFEIMELQECR